jgi:hypothetical protein
MPRDPWGRGVELIQRCSDKAAATITGNATRLWIHTVRAPRNGAVWAT